MYDFVTDPIEINNYEFLMQNDELNYFTQQRNPSNSFVLLVV